MDSGILDILLKMEGPESSPFKGLTDVWHKHLQLMKGTEKPHMDKHKEITNCFNHDASSTPTSLSVSDLKNYALDFCCIDCTSSRTALSRPLLHDLVTL
jgi:hypothetical protein